MKKKTYRVELETVEFAGLMRPKCFHTLTVYDLMDDKLFVMAYVKSGPFLKRLRLWMALNRAKRSLRKLKKFCANQGISI
jgi:hypothetical protein